MLNTLISLSLESVGKLAEQQGYASQTGSRSAMLGSYPALRSALLQAERRGALESERRMLMARLRAN